MIDECDEFLLKKEDVNKPYVEAYYDEDYFEKLLVGDMYYNFVHDDGQYFLEEKDVKEPCMRPCITLMKESHMEKLLLVEKRGEDEAYYEIIIFGGMSYNEGINDHANEIIIVEKRRLSLL